jgi:murein DD-endopeptidase MepM/ murein hydrolase activator NlpD
MFRLTLEQLFFVLCLLFAGAVLMVGAMVSPGAVRAQETADELRQKISESQKALEAIEKEIKQFEAQLNEVGAEKKTLQTAIRELDLARKKLQGDIRATEQKISSTDLEIEELSREITIKELEISKNVEAIGATFRTIDRIEQQTMLEMLLGHESLAEVWDTLAAQSNLQESLREDVRILEALKAQYESAKDKTEDKRDELDVLKNNLSGEEDAVASTIYQKDVLLDQTKNEEAEYQRILAQKRAAREQFEREMASFEAQLKFILDPSTIPAAGSGVLRWPFEGGLMANCLQRKSAFGNDYCLTQYFGNTAFARSGAYNGKGHNGIDFGVPTGTKVLAALGGTVVETGNTDAVPGCLSYGKWVLIKHGNGLSTLYAHLSSINVSGGQSVATGQVIGHSGNTGYSTGPHLHFTVYASKGVDVVRLGDVKAITSCGPARVPVAGFEAYLNPLDYL